MRWLLFDTEVYPEWFCLCIKEKDSDNKYAITSDSLRPLDMISEWMSNPENIFTGFNIKGYDLKILELALRLYQQEMPPMDICRQLFALSNDIVGGTAKRGYPFNLCSFTDLKDDVSDWISLKEYESNKGMEIKETDIPFGTSRLTPEQKQAIVFYCFKDVEATEQMLKDRWNYVQTKLRLASRFGLNAFNALKRTDPSLCADILVKDKYAADTSFLGSKITYAIPESLAPYINRYLPKWIIDEFLDYEHFASAKKEIELFDNYVTIGEGGAHSVHKKNRDGVLYVGQKEGWVNVSADGSSYYPHLIACFDYQPRTVTDKTLYPSILAERMAIKDLLAKDPSLKKGEEGKKSTDLKLILNSTGGAMMEPHSILYDPQRYISRCFTGQLLLFALCNHCYKDFGAVIIQTNTDGVYMSVPLAFKHQISEAMKEWQILAKMPLEVATFEKLWQNNVNNYVMLHKDGSLKIVGKWLWHSIDPFKNIQFYIINKAITNYLVYGKSLVDTVYEETDPMMFLYTVKKGPTFENTVIRHGRTEEVLGKVNRIYASLGKNSGMLYKTKGQLRQHVPNCPVFAQTYNEKVESMPESLDRMWYVKEATTALTALSRIDLL